MVSFSCEVCNEALVKKKLDQHRQRCRGAYFTCIDCSHTFSNSDYRLHTSCISEAEKYEKALYKGPRKPLLSHTLSGKTSPSSKSKEVSENDKGGSLKVERVKMDQRSTSKTASNGASGEKSGEKSDKTANDSSTESKKSRGDSSDVSKVTKSIFTKALGASDQSMYKVLKKISKKQNLKIEDVLKKLNVRLIDGQVCIAERKS